jgi:hypothetical protein
MSKSKKRKCVFGRQKTEETRNKKQETGKSGREEEKKKNAEK